ncbi:Cuticlin-1 [Aphelenchoides besseyi]|nr:Cuticlin-1 [Aphelenchoides besseyi]
MRRSMPVFSLFKFLLLFVAQVLAHEYTFSNSLAKVCHPVDLPLDLLFMIDGSGSVGGPTFDTQIATLNRIIEMADIGPRDTQIAVLQYSTYTYVEFPFKAHNTRESLQMAVNQIRHRSGTTKTGKALDKALQLFANKASGARFGQPDNVQQIAVVVSDGHSHDDPFPAANRLRQAGVRIIALGIGQHINMNELTQITGDARYAFENLTLASTVEKFTDAFRRITVGEQCEYLRGADGAQIDCLSDSIQVGVTMEKSFNGVMYIDGHFGNPACQIRPNSTDFDLRVGLTDCGISRQFLINPKGFAFETTAVLQFHPEFSTALDRRFRVHCFYQDQNEANELDWQLIKEHTQRKNKDDTKMMPCSYTIEQIDKRAADSCGSAQNFFLGESVIHRWSCSAEHFDAYQSVFIRNCEYVDLRTNSAHKLIDENGCSLLHDLLETPKYTSSTTAHARGVIFRRPDSPLGKIRCEIQFCDRLMTECEKILPPQCHGIAKRQAGFAVGIRPLNWEQSPPLVTFGKMDKLKSMVKRRRNELEQSVSASFATKANSEPVIQSRGSSLDVKLSTQNVKVIDSAVDKFTETTILPTTETPTVESVSKLTDCTSIDCGNDQGINEAIAADSSRSDPFQGEWKQISSGIEDPMDLDEFVIQKLSIEEIFIESPILNVQNPRNVTCRFRN